MNLNLQDSEPLPPENQLKTGAGILLGLLLTFGLHMIHVCIYFLLPLKGKAELIPLFFGFTQLLYMLPVIVYFQRRDNRGMMIGLIISASITFVLGLPLASFGVLCATEAAPNFH